MNAESTDWPLELCAALVVAQGVARTVEKSAENKFHKYKYVSADAMIAEGREALNAGGLALVPADKSFEPANETSTTVGRIRTAYRLVHKSGSVVIRSGWPVVPEKGRPVDKAEAGAMTEDLSYVIRALLLIPRVDEGTSVETRPDPEPRRAARVEREEAPAAPACAAAPITFDGGPTFAIAADFKRRVRELPDVEGFAVLVPEVEAAGLPAAQLQDVRAELAVVGLRFAVEREDLDFWIEKIRGWQLAGEPLERARDAYNAADDRIAAFVEAEERAGMVEVPT